MDSTLFVTFLIVSFVLIVVPGPNVLVIVSTSLINGRVRGLQTVAGTSVAMAIQLFVAAIATTSFTQLLTEGFEILKWLGAVYLIYLGVAQVKCALSGAVSTKSGSASATFARGFWVSITNPKTIVFFSAFLPQFISSAGSYLTQIMLLSTAFLMLAVVLDSCYALLASKLGPLLEKHFMPKIQHGVSGVLFLAAGAWLATSRRA